MTFPAQQRKGPGAVLVGSAVRTFTDGDADRGRSAQRTLPLRTVAGLPQFCTSPFSRDESDRRSPLRFSLSRRVACSRRSIPTPRKRLASLEAPACPTRIGEAAFYNGRADRWHPRVIAFADRWLAPPGALRTARGRLEPQHDPHPVGQRRPNPRHRSQNPASRLEEWTARSIEQERAPRPIGDSG
jgi:hypothetical protein